MRMPDGISPEHRYCCFFITVRKLYSAEKSLANFIKFYKESIFCIENNTGICYSTYRTNNAEYNINL